MHCNLTLPKTRQPLPALITTPCQVWSRWTYPLPYYSVVAADTLLYAVTLTFDLEHLQRIACDAMKLCTKFERNRAIQQGYCDFSVWPYDLWSLRCVALGSRIIFTKFDLRQLIRDWIIAFFYTDTLCHAVTLTFDPLILKVRCTSTVTWSKYLRNLSEIVQSPAELLIILQMFAHVILHRDLDLWPLDLELLQHFSVIRLNSVQNLSEIK